MDKTDKLFYKELKRIQKEHTPPKYDRCKPYPWKKEWGPFVKYDCDWAGVYLLDMIIYKIEKMRLAMDLYSDEVREDLEKRLASMDQAIALGKKLITFDYYSGSSEWSDQHCAHAILIYLKGSIMKKGSKPIHKILKWHKSKDLDFDAYFGEHEVAQWAKENGYERKDLEICYSGEWDSENNYKIWNSKLKEERKKEQKDYDDFFKIIARNLNSWGY